MQETWVRALDQEYSLEKEMPTHASIPAWEMSWTEEPVSPQGRKELDMKSQTRSNLVHTWGTQSSQIHTWLPEAGRYKKWKGII